MLKVNAKSMFIWKGNCAQWAKSPKRQSVGVYFDMALYFECRINKNTLLQTVLFDKISLKV